MNRASFSRYRDAQIAQWEKQNAGKTHKLTKRQTEVLLKLQSRGPMPAGADGSVLLALQQKNLARCVSHNPPYAWAITQTGVDHLRESSK